MAAQTAAIHRQGGGGLQGAHESDQVLLFLVGEFGSQNKVEKLDGIFPDRISAWFAGKVPFRVELPNYQAVSGEKKQYDIQGARLVGYKNDYAAHVVYRMGQRRISLLMSSQTAAQPTGGEKIIFNGIAFHHDSIGGLKVITWSHRGLTYALVSDLEERGQDSCMVCHEGSKNLVAGMKPNT